MGSLSLMHWLVVIVLICVIVLFVKLLLRLLASFPSSRATATAESRLQELERLKSKGLVSAAEYEQQRSSIIRGI